MKGGQSSSKGAGSGWARERKTCSRCEGHGREWTNAKAPERSAVQAKLCSSEQGKAEGGMAEDDDESDNEDEEEEAGDYR